MDEGRNEKKGWGDVCLWTFELKRERESMVKINGVFLSLSLVFQEETLGPLSSLTSSHQRSSGGISES